MAAVRPEQSESPAWGEGAADPAAAVLVRARIEALLRDPGFAGEVQQALSRRADGAPEAESPWLRSFIRGDDGALRLGRGASGRGPRLLALRRWIFAGACDALAAFCGR